MKASISRRKCLVLAAAMVAAGRAKAFGLRAAVRGVGFLEPCAVRPRYKNRVHFFISGQYWYCVSNDIPDHNGGRFPDRGCPNTIRPQEFHFRMPLQPRENARLLKVVNHVDFGVAIDGVVLDPGTAEFWHNKRGSVWNVTLLTGFGNLGLDAIHAHVQPDGTYHYHGAPTELIKSRDGWGKVVLIGYAADGFPVYGPWGYKNAPRAAGGIRLLQSSHRIKRGNRPNPSIGPGGPYDGRYTGDFEYVPGYGDMDEANGRHGVTPEYPDGTYYYVATDQYPFIPRYFRGRPDRSFYKRPSRNFRQGGQGGRTRPFGGGLAPGDGGLPPGGPPPFGPPGADGGY